MREPLLYATLFRKTDMTKYLLNIRYESYLFALNVDLLHDMPNLFEHLAQNTVNNVQIQLHTVK